MRNSLPICSFHSFSCYACSSSVIIARIQECQSFALVYVRFTDSFRALFASITGERALRIESPLTDVKAPTVLLSKAGQSSLAKGDCDCSDTRIVITHQRACYPEQGGLRFRSTVVVV